MKKNNFYFLPVLMVCLVCFFSCQKEEVEKLPELEEMEIIYEDHSVRISELQKISDKTLNLGEAHNLPLEVGIKLENGEIDTFPVEWNGYFNPVKEGQYIISGKIFTKHKPYIIPPENIKVSLTVATSHKNTISAISDYSEKYCLMGVGDIFVTDNIPLSAIKRNEAIIKETLLDEYEVLIRVIESEEEKKLYDDSTLLMKNFNWQQMALVLKRWEPDYTTYNDLVAPFDDNNVILNIVVVYRYAKQEVTGHIVLTDEAQKLFEQDTKLFENTYGEEYISSITLGHYSVMNIVYNKMYSNDLEKLYDEIALLIMQKNGRTDKTEIFKSLTAKSICYYGLGLNVPINTANTNTEYLDAIKEFVNKNPNKEYEEMYIEYSKLPLN